MAKTARAPDGTTWRVGRKWTPWRLRWRGREPDIPDVPDVVDFADDDGCLTSIVVSISIVVAVVLAVFFVFPAVVLVLEAAIVLLLVGGVAFANVVLRRPWIVTAERNGMVARTWKRVGWRASGRLVDDVVTAIDRGQPLPF